MEGRTMTDAPKEIAPAPRDVWLCPCGYESWRNAWVEDRPNTPNSKGEVQYTRTDIHEAELSALRDAVLEEVARIGADPEKRGELIEQAYALLRKNSRGVRGQTVTEWDGVEAWLVMAYVDAIRAMKGNAEGTDMDIGAIKDLASATKDAELQILRDAQLGGLRVIPNHMVDRPTLLVPEATWKALVAKFGKTRE